MNESDSIDISPPIPFATPAGTKGGATVVFGSPQRYVQGNGVIDHAGHYLRRLGLQQVVVLCTRRSQLAEGQRLLASLEAANIGADILTFAGECSFEEIDRQVALVRSLQCEPRGLVAMGGGKAVDAGKAIAHRLDLPCVVVPTLASNDAPCAAVSVIYTDEGVTLDVEIYDESPLLVLVDTGVVAAASERHLVAGIGDAMATWYEARACAQNPEGVNAFGGRPALAGIAIGKLCAETLFEFGCAALEAARNSLVTPALEKVVEANTLLSGLGYESGGLAAAHAYAQGFTVLDRVHRNYLHGEMVAIGTLAQLHLQGDDAEARRVTEFFLQVGLPVHLGHLGLSGDDEEALTAVVKGAMAFPFLGNLIADTSQFSLLKALRTLDETGRRLATAGEDKAYQALHR